MPLAPPPLNIQPTGLLDFLQIKNGGQYPQHLGTTLAPAWDLRQHYEYVNASVQPPTGGFVLPATGSNQFMPLFGALPTWRYFCSISLEYVPLNALDSINGQWIMQNINGERETLYPLGNQGTTRPDTLSAIAAGAGLPRIMFGRTDFWLPPNWDLGIFFQDLINTGGANEFAVAARLVSYRA